MKEYDTGLNVTALSAIVIAVVVVGGLFAASMLIPPITPTTTTPTTTGGSYGIRAAEYLNSRRDDIAFYWLYNSTFVNEDLSSFYSESHAGAFVDGVKMEQTESGGDIEVLFAPWDHSIVGTGSVDTTTWETLGGNLVDGALAQMTDHENQDMEWPHTWPVSFIIEIYFDDNTFLGLGYTESDQLVHIQNGTWSGGFTEWGWPDVTGFSEGYNLNAGGLMDAPIQSFYNAITQNVAYPSE